MTAVLMKGGSQGIEKNPSFLESCNLLINLNLRRKIMKLGKLLGVAMLVVLIVGPSFAKTRAGDKVSKVANKVWVIPYTQVAPKLDGLVDSVWNAIDAQPFNYFNCSAVPVTDWTDLSGWCKLMWDDSTLYGLFYSMDDVIDTTYPSTNWQMDGVEFYADAGNTHITETARTATQYQFCMRPAEPVDSVCTATGHGEKYKWFLDTTSINKGGPTGYYVQFQFPLDSLGITAQAGQKLSLELQQDDNDNTSGNRIHISKWWNSSGADDDWYQTLHWGDAVLGDAVTGEEVDANCSYVFLHTSTPPVIDANTDANAAPTDACWDDANQVTMNNLDAAASSYVAGPQDQSWRFYGLYDDTNIYGFFVVYDDVVWTQYPSTNWQMDGVEFYVDAANSHITETARTATQYQYEFRPPEPVDSVCLANGKGMNYTWKLLNTVPNDSVFSSMSGYAVEFKFPLDSLGLVAQEGTKFSFELQTDDNDGTSGNRIHVTKWWNMVNDDDWYQTLHWGNAILGPNEVLGVKAKPAPVANAYKLEQNYPNPFNPTTQIKYSVAQTGFVTLKVYNVLGQQVSTLFSGVRKAGQDYTATFDGSRLSSGVYFYKLEAGNQMLVKKLMLLK